MPVRHEPRLLSLAQYRALNRPQYDLDRLGRDRTIAVLRRAATKVARETKHDSVRAHAYRNLVFQTLVIDDLHPLPKAPARRLARELLFIAESHNALGAFLLIQSALEIYTRLGDRRAAAACRTKLANCVKHAASVAREIRDWLRELDAPKATAKRRTR